MKMRFTRFRISRAARRFLPVAFLTVGVAVLGTLAGCNGEKSMAGPDNGGNADMNVPASLKIGDLPSDLNLTSEQRTGMEAALDKLDQARREKAQAMRAHRGAGRRGGPHGRGGAGWAPGGQGWAPGGQGEPPMLSFVEESSKILSPDQFAVLAHFLAQRRETAWQQRTQDGSHEGPWMAQGMHGRFGRMAAKRLGLSDEQQKQLDPILKSNGEKLRRIHEQVASGALTRDQAHEQAQAVHAEMQDQIKAILTPEQWAKVEKFRGSRREQMTGRVEETMPERLDRRAEFLGRVLQLSDQQAADVKRIYEGTEAERTALLEQIRSGKLQPGEAFPQMRAIEEKAQSEVRALLTPEQTTRFDALLELMPQGPGPGFGHGFGPDGPGRPGR